MISLSVYELLDKMKICVNFFEIFEVQIKENKPLFKKVYFDSIEEGLKTVMDELLEKQDKECKDKWMLERRIIKECTILDFEIYIDDNYEKVLKIYI